MSNLIYWLLICLNKKHEIPIKRYIVWRQKQRNTHWKLKNTKQKKNISFVYVALVDDKEIMVVSRCFAVHEPSSKKNYTPQHITEAMSQTKKGCWTEIQASKQTCSSRKKVDELHQQERWWHAFMTLFQILSTMNEDSWASTRKKNRNKERKKKWH